ncbi:MAG: hypothetical protein LBP88_04800 [Treponema sp.]|jgi:hypothetical protein|nr:hypothetical protein [Treponema sp.]
MLKKIIVLSLLLAVCGSTAFANGTGWKAVMLMAGGVGTFFVGYAVEPGDLRNVIQVTGGLSVAAGLVVLVFAMLVEEDDAFKIADANSINKNPILRHVAFDLTSEGGVFLGTQFQW